jgi:hypothetical protein
MSEMSTMISRILYILIKMTTQEYANCMKSLFTPSKDIKASKGVCRGLAHSPKINARFDLVAPPKKTLSPSASVEIASQPKRKLTRGRSLLMLFALPNKEIQKRVGL